MAEWIDTHVTLTIIGNTKVAASSRYIYMHVQCICTMYYILAVSLLQPLPTYQSGNTSNDQLTAAGMWKIHSVQPLAACVIANCSVQPPQTENC